MRWKFFATIILLAVLIGGAFSQGVWARSIESLIDLASRDALPEVRAAAGLALGELLVNSSFSNVALEEMAVDGPSQELRGAAGEALSQRLLVARLSLEELETLACGPTPELRGAAIPALVQATVAAVGRGELSLQGLASAIARGASHELRLARAQALFLLLRAALVAPEAQAAVEAILRGASVEVEGVEIDGGVEEVRAAASDFLAGIYKFYGFLNRLQDPLNDLMAVVTDASLTPEFRAAAGKALEVVFCAQRDKASDVLQRLEGLLDEIKEKAQDGEAEDALQALSTSQKLLEGERQMLITTAEVAGEFTTAQRLERIEQNLAKIHEALTSGDLISLNSAITAVERDLRVVQTAVERAPDVPLNKLENWAASGATLELRRAAGATLGARLLEAGLNIDELMEVTVQGASPELRAGAGEALATKLIELNLGETDLLKMIARYTLAFGDHPGTSPQLGQALSRALGERFKEDISC